MKKINSIIVMLLVFVISTLYSQNNSDVIIVLAMHGSVPNDFPKDELALLFKYHGKSNVKPKIQELEEKLLNWERNEKNDPYYAGAIQLKDAIEKELNFEVIVAFNEFCNPSVDKAIIDAVNNGKKKVFVVTPMLTLGGGHSEKDIPAAIELARNKISSDIIVEYVWPIEPDHMAKFLSYHILEKMVNSN